MGLLKIAMSRRRLWMKVFEIDNPDSDDATTMAVTKGKKIILIPYMSLSKSILVDTGGHVPHVSIGNIIFKYCHRCKEWKPLQCFVKNCHAKDGYKDSCKECDNKRRREKYAREKAIH